jgi:hypothetical protein
VDRRASRHFTTITVVPLGGDALTVTIRKETGGKGRKEAAGRGKQAAEKTLS